MPIARVELADEAATERLATEIARVSRTGDVIGLAGELGCGKTTFARAFLRARLRLLGGRDGEAAEIEVPSPTFTLVEAYDLPGGLVCHFDLYRIERPEEALEIGIEESFANAVTLLEWPERLGAYLPADHLLIRLDFGGTEEARTAVLLGSPGWAARLRGVPFLA